MKNAKDLTREETIKALLVCSTVGGRCKQCPLHDFVRPGLRCFDDLMAHAAEILETALSVQYE
ncbi:MAG: hypothetical protein IKD61_02105 [Oscillospiraceae bacterium]|nr:hypothetical protein [Oscillospiraceae bacterium]